jgi:glycosyltransferase involved in cell wall biosynthesis
MSAGARTAKRVLVSAYACEPGKGSEPGVGWNQVRQLARFHEVWVITRSNNREPIQRARPAGCADRLHWVYFDLPPWLRFWKRGKRGVHLYYLLWQIGAYWAGRGLQRRVGFDVVHHVTFANYWLPGLLALLPAPFVWGPVGGGESFPPRFLRSFSLRGRVHERLRSLARRFGECSPLVRWTAARSSIALAATPQTAARLKRLGCRRVRLFPQIGMTREELGALQPAGGPKGAPFRLVSVGELLHLKGFDLGLRAFARFREGRDDSEYFLVGDGPERRSLEGLARRLGVAPAVRFLGGLERARVLALLPRFDVLVLPSFHDSGGLACLEAMAAGLPVVCLDLGGPARIVTERTGFRIRALHPRQIVEDLAGCLARLAADPAQARALGLAGRRRVETLFSWEAKGEQMARIYEGLGR